MTGQADKLLEALRASVKETERLRQQNRQLVSAASEPLAIVGMSCRYPGGVTTPEELWELVSTGGDAIAGVPADRGWDTEDLHDPGRPDSSSSAEGGFLRDAAAFDADFFGISPREALAMDPQQRLLLETSWEALERAGVAPASLRGSQIGVFVGVGPSDYGANPALHTDDLQWHLITGGATSVMSGRISYLLGLQGPAVSVDTACSSSLVALHLAAQAVRAGECSLALAGGATVMASAIGIRGFSRQDGLAADGRCKAFSADADGMGMGEGAGMVVVERLSDARRNGHPVLAVLRGSAVNQDGASNGLTAPNGPSQQRVIRAALAGARLTASEVDVVEAHGTGTKLGDPIEAQALLATYGQERPEGRPLWLGSVKSNIGHAQQAAGVAGVIKMVLALQHGELPRTLHADEPSPHVDWASGEVKLLTEPVPWPSGDRVRRAGVSSFGLSGTNAHVILEEAPAGEGVEAVGEPGESGEPVVPVVAGAGAWVLSGRTAGALAAQAGRLGEWVSLRPALRPVDVAWSLAATRSVFEHRAVVVGGDREQVLAGLGGLASGVPGGAVVSGVARLGVRPVFAFAGQGSQWVGMGRELAGASPVFAARLDECAAALEPYVDWSLTEVLAGAEGAPALEAADVVQPALWAVMVSLAAVWEAAGVVPEAVVGHSQGEIAAATVAGMLSLEAGARVVALRSQALKVLAGAGGMLSVSRPASEVQERLARFGERVSLAAVNGPSATVVSGEPEALEELRAEFEAEGARARMVAVDYASHSAQVDRLEEEITTVLAGISPRRGRVPMVSAMTGETLTGEELDAGYWFRSLRATVDYDRAVRVLAGQGHQVFVEVTPHPVLVGAMHDTLQDLAQEAGPGVMPAAVCGTLRRDEGGADRLVASLAEAFVNGASVDWQAVLPAGQRVELPTYAFQHERFWPKVAAAAFGGDPMSLGLGAVGHPLLGAAVELAGGAGLVCTGRLSVRTHPWLADHAVGGVVLLPGTGFVELAVCAGDQAGCGVLEELTLQAPLVFPEDGAAVQVQVVLAGPDAEGRRAVEVFSRSDVAGQSQGWTQHASGVLAPAGPAAAAEDDFAVWPPRDATTVDVSGFYQAAGANSYGYGPAFQGLRAVWRRGEDVFAEVALPEEVAQDAAAFGLHPALLDAVLHASALLEAEGEPGEIRLPFAWTGVELHASGASVLRARLRRDAQGTLAVTAADAAGQPVISVASLITRPVDTGQLGSAVPAVADALFTVAWMPISGTESVAPVSGEWALIGADRFGVAEALGRTGITVQCFPGLEEAAAAVEAGQCTPAFVLVCGGGEGRSGEDPARAAARVTGETLVLVQEWLGEERLADSRLVILTRAAAAVSAGEGVADLPAATLAGLVRSAQSENPDRLLLVDLPATGTGEQVTELPVAVATGEPELALRNGAVHARRLVRPSGALPVPEGRWRLEPDAGGSLEGLSLLPAPEADEPLAVGQARIAVGAAGLNFRDVLIALGMYPGGGVLGSEIAGTVLEAGPGVDHLVPGDRVTGIGEGGFGPVVVTDARQLVRIPDGWSFAEAASVPTAFMTAWYALVELAGAKPGQRVLVHAATGGVGMAAVQIARYLGLEVFATASPGKWPVLAAMGLDAEHVSSSRSAAFEADFLAATDGAGVDIVVNSLAGELTDASLRLLPRGGAFVEMGRTDVRDAQAVAADRPGVTYRSFDLGEAGPEGLGTMLGRIVELLSAGELQRLPMRAWEVRRARDAFRFMQQARHTGKIVLTIPVHLSAAQQPESARPGSRSALITGGTGTLGSLVAGHLVVSGRAQHVVLTSRSGPGAAGVAALAARLAQAGASVQVVACDAADRPELAAVVAAVPAGYPLRTVVHTAGVLDDGTVASLTAQRVAGVLRPKADGAWNLHELTRDLVPELEDFVLFSSSAAAFGVPGQGNYVAANAFLDALAAQRRASGLPGVSLGWGLWAEVSGLTGQLAESDRSRMSRGGALALSADEGLALLDLCLARDEALLVPSRLDLAGLRAQAARSAQVPPLWRALVGASSGRRSAARAGDVGADSLHQRLAGLSGQERTRLLTDLVRTHAAAVLGHASAEAVEAGRAFTDLGFDSLTAVELRNRLSAATGLRLPATLVFDYPNPAALAGHLRARIIGDGDGDGQAVSPLPVGTTQQTSGEPIAIVGLACRFPGGVNDPEGFWRLLADGTDAVSRFPDDRGWDVEALYDPDPDSIGTSYTREGGFIGDAGGFDADFFGISPREALAMDPQQRQVLETSWEALERAGIDPSALRGSQTGVFVGGFASAYGIGVATGDEGAEGNLTTGFATSVLSGRVSYALGLEGPAVTVDTACSSSLVALHLACQAVRAGECSMALAGGSTIISTPDGIVGFSRQRGLAADGRCKAFSADADGMGFAEGTGVLVVERLSDARRNGHPVLAVVRGSAVNQDGASNGLTAPNGPSQQRVIRAALAGAHLTAADVDVVEAHGTGTKLGDPIEAQALLATYGQERPEGRPLWLGSVKSNIGHTQAAAGVAGVIKMVLALQHGQLPRTLHADEPSPHIDWTEGEVRLLTEPVPWQTNDRPRIAGISSFGISGTNAHVLLEEAPAEEPAHSNGYPVDADAAASAPVLSMAGADPTAETVSAWLVSGRSAAGLAAQADRLRDWLTARPELGSTDVAWSLAATRSVFEHRAVVVGGAREQVLAGLAGLASGTPSGALVAGTARSDARPVFAFAGQGSQWVGMGRELARTSPVFAGRLAECAAALAPYVDWSLSDVLAGAEDAPALEAADVVQPALWAVMVSLAAVWEAAGVAPDAVVGHSQGEIAAATVAGMLSLQDGARVVALRSRALKVLAGAGGMLSVSRPAAEVEERLGRFGDRVSLAAVNGPSATVISGEPAALEELKSEFEAAGARARMVAVDYASHCAQVDRLEEEITTVLAGISPRRGRVPMVSAMTGETLTGEELDAGYWFRSLRATVHYDRAVRVLAGQGHQMFVEVTPHPVLMGAMNDTLEEVAQEAGPGIVPAAVCGTLRRDEGGPAQLVTSLAEAFVNGASVDWQAVLPAGKRVELPTYAFQHERFWPKAAATVSGGDPVSLGLGAVGHPLLGAAVELAGGEGLVCTGRLSMRTHPWLADHAVGGVVLLPGTGFVELAVRAGDQVGCGVLEELTLQAPLAFPEDGAAVQIQVMLAGPDAEGRRSVEVFSRSDAAGQSQGWTQHASGTLAPAGPAAEADDDFEVWPPRNATTVDVSHLYQSATEGPYGYGPAFQGLRAAWRRGEDVFAEVALPEEVAQGAAAFGLHPALMDAVLQAAFLMGDAEESATEEVRLPFAWTGVELHASGASVLRARLRRDAQGTLTVTAADAAGQPVISVTSLITRPVDTSQLGSAVSPVADALFTVAWMPISGTESIAPAAGEWALIGADRFDIAEALSRTGITVQCFPGLKELAAATADRKIDPAFVLVCAGGEGPSEEDPARAAARMTGETLLLAQEWLGEDRLADSRLVILTRGAVAVSADEGVADLPAAALAGLVRSAQSENPDRLLLVDLPATNTADQIAVLPDALPAALAVGEPEVAIRDTAAHGRRLTRPSGSTAAVERPANPSGARSALITGGTGTLGGLVAGHLVVSGRAEHVVLTSRSGPGAAGAAVLAARLAQAGASVQVTACDAADRQKLTAVMATIPVQAPLRTVVHTAGVLDDGTVGSLTAQRVAGVLRPKADGAWNLHELTQGLDLDHFVLFSSSAAAFGVPGQGNYVAANAFLDALAAERRASGLPGVSLGWGLWAEVSGLTGQLAESDRSRMSRGGALALSADEGLALLDLCLARDEAVLVPSRLDLAGLRAQAARSAQVPPLWRALVGAGTGRRSAAGTDDANADSLHRQLAALPAAERDEMLLNLVRAHVAAVLGHASAEAVEPGRAFTDLGFDSLTAVQLRNRLNTATGLRLPATLVFDYPNPAALAGHLRGRLGDGPQARTKAATVPAPAETSGAGAPDEPIAIVGMSCRFPGGTAGPEDLWRMLRDGEDAISAFPTDRGWDLDGLHDPDAARSGTARTQAGGFVQDAASFDAGFFEISPREALAMDPQQRLLLELAWEAFERSGIDPATLRSSPTGTFVGGYTSGYETSVLAQGGAESQGHLMTGIATSVLSGRLAYTFGLEGPAVTVDTACSSALVALHLAAQSLRSGECSLALAGGVTVMATPGTFVEFSRQRGLAADGRCKAFAAAADGTGFAEGAGLLVIERLSDAQRNGHPVLAVLRGSATNQDGASNGLTAPNGPSQQRVIRAALANSRLAPGDVDVVEAHGTGTKLGDPIEAQALLATYGQDRGEGDPLWLGSVKSNIGHTQAAAGVAGVIKMVLALQHGELPRTLHVDEPSPHIDWTGGEVRLLTEPMPWQANGRPRRAGVSSFGISGTNAHVILEEAPAPPAGSDRHVPSAGPESHVPPLAAESHVPPAGPETHVGPPSDAATAPAAGSAVPSAVPWPLSARTLEALRAQAGRLRQFLLERPELDLVDVGFSLATTRTAFDHRAVVQGTDRDGLLAGLAVAAAGVQTRDVVTGTAKAGRKPVFVFPGAAASPGGPGAGVRLDAVAALLEESPVFADRIADCEQALAPFVDWKVTEVLRAGEDSPALTTPEIHRPVLWAVLVALAALWRSAGVHPAAVAGHGVGEIAAAQVAGVLTTADAARLAVLCGGTPAGPGVVQPRPGTVPLYSTRSMDWVDGAELNADHWLPYPGQEPPVPVRELAEALAGAGLGAYVEVGPEPVLATALTQALQAEGSGADRDGAPVVTATLRRGELGLRAFTSALATLHVRGVTVDWAAVLGGGRRVDLPTYAFQRERYWPQPPARTAAEAPAAGSLSPDEQRLWSALAEQDMSALSEVLGTGTPLREDMPLGEVLAYVAAWRRERTASDGTAETDAAGTAEGTAPEGAHGAGADWRQRLAEVGPAQQQELLSALVREEIAAMLGYGSVDSVPQYGDVFELGMTSMSAVQLRLRMNELTGLTLPEGFVYDLYMPEAIAEYLLGELTVALRAGTPEDR
ncbi:SDR family NAD(P)-dependent oxidoreductase [Streptomyces chrestomyceticus]|uniref:SDR family NAD(P)-dependent oxidoreductase n=1 Tax=Streptomyces chrestomyceticus TaxID=68185 RepID=UPI0036AF6514